MMDENTNHLFIKACFGQRVERTPVWMMRQAGRYLPEYRQIRQKYNFTGMYKTPDVATEVTLQPVDILGVDAAILFSDILVVPEAMGMELHFIEEKGPQFTDPLRSEKQIRQLPAIHAESELGYVLQAIRNIRQELNNRVPLIGFSGAPWTLATYMIEGSGSRNYKYIKTLRFGNPALLHELLEKVTVTVIDYCKAQIENGVQAVQLFDSWAGMLDEEGFYEFALPYVQRIIKEIRKPGVPVIYFAKGAMAWLDKLSLSGADVLGLDWTIDPVRAVELIKNKTALQGNLDPTALYAPPAEIRAHVKKMLKGFNGAAGHVANLGHGILPDIPVDHARAFIDAVKEES